LGQQGARVPKVLKHAAAPLTSPMSSRSANCSTGRRRSGARSTFW
jgi:hypothetical protein